MKIKFIFVVIVAMFAVSISPILVQAILQNSLQINNDSYISGISLSLAFWRMAIGSCILWIFTFFNRQKTISKINRNYSIISGFFLALHFYFFFESIRLSNISNATFLGTLAPIFTMFIEIFFLRRRVSYKIILPILLIIFGSSILVYEDFDFSSTKTIGNIYAILCSLWFGICFIISDKVRQTEGTINYSKILYTSAALTLYIIANYYNVDLYNFNFKNTIYILLLGIIPNLLGHNLLYYSIKYISPTIVSCIPLGEPVIASVLAYFLFGQAVSIFGVIGGGVIILGLFFLLVNKSSNVT